MTLKERFREARGYSLSQDLTKTNALRPGFFVFVVVLLVKPVGIYLERVFERRQTLLDPILLPTERLTYRLAGIDCQREMDWKHYSVTFVTHPCLVRW